MMTEPPTTIHAQPGQHLFCYGTLQIPAVLEAVIGRSLCGIQATLPGYGAFKIRRAEYPGLLPSPFLATRGMLYRDVTIPELQILDRFEGRLYQRRRRVIVKDNGQRAHTWVYTMAAGKSRQLTRTPWDFQRFMQVEYRRFMKRFVTDRRAEYVQETV